MLPDAQYFAQSPVSYLIDSLWQELESDIPGAMAGEVRGLI
jgi:hypothetical protein